MLLFSVVKSAAQAAGLRTAVIDHRAFKGDRAGFDAAARAEVKRLYGILFRSGVPLSRAVAEAAAGTGEVSRYAADLGGDATRTGAAATQLRGASAGLSRQAEKLRAQVDGFLDGLRAV
jgi:hypothetical protein